MLPRKVPFLKHCTPFLPEVFLGDVGAVPELAEVADPYVALEAHQDGAVD